MTRDDIVAAARSALGTPFKHQGRMAGKGLDCAGLLVHVVTALGLPVADRSGYARHPSSGELESALAEHVALGILVQVPVNAVQAGDFVLMRFETERENRHLGVIGHGDMLIHAWAVVRKVCEHRIDDQWRRRIVAAWRIAGVDDGR